jgi:hypothetical protein
VTDMEFPNQHKAIEAALGWVTTGVASRILHWAQIRADVP